MDKRRLIRMAPGIIGIFIIAGCVQPEPEISTIDWQPDGEGFLQFKTNDASIGGFYRDFSCQNAIFDEASASTLDISLKALSGPSGYGFGANFCKDASGDAYQVLFAPAGAAIVQKRVAGEWIVLHPWTATPAFKAGYGQVNRLRISLEGVKYRFYVNEIFQAEWDPDPEVGPSGACEFTNWIPGADLVRYPYDSVDRRFSMAAPAVIP
jgi:hypothetical protein